MEINIENFEYIKNFFKDLSFNEDKHLYTVNNDILPSVSKLIKSYHEEFNAHAASLGTAQKTGKSQEQVLQEWKETGDEARSRGHRVHHFGEMYPWDRTLIPRCAQEWAVKKFWDELPEHIVPAFMELRMYHKIYKYAGTADILLFNTIDRTFILADYKTNKDLFKNFKGQKLRFPFTNYLDTPFSKYTLQLSYYQMLFEQTGSKISRRIIIWLDLEGNYQMYNTENEMDKLNYELIIRN